MTHELQWGYQTNDSSAPCPSKKEHQYFLRNYNKSGHIFEIFGLQHPEETVTLKT